MTQAARKKRVVIVEYGITRLTAAQIDALLLRSLIGNQNVTIKIENRP